MYFDSEEEIEVADGREYGSIRAAGGGVFAQSGSIKSETDTLENKNPVRAVTEELVNSARHLQTSALAPDIAEEFHQQENEQYPELEEEAYDNARQSWRRWSSESNSLAGAVFRGRARSVSVVQQTHRTSDISSTSKASGSMNNEKKMNIENPLVTFPVRSVSASRSRSPNQHVFDRMYDHHKVYSKRREQLKSKVLQDEIQEIENTKFKSQIGFLPSSPSLKDYTARRKGDSFHEKLYNFDKLWVERRDRFVGTQKKELDERRAKQEIAELTLHPVLATTEETTRYLSLSRKPKKDIYASLYEDRNFYGNRAVERKKSQDSSMKESMSFTPTISSRSTKIAAERRRSRSAGAGGRPSTQGTGQSQQWQQLRASDDTGTMNNSSVVSDQRFSGSDGGHHHSSRLVSSGSEEDNMSPRTTDTATGGATTYFDADDIIIAASSSSSSSSSSDESKLQQGRSDGHGRHATADNDYDVFDGAAAQLLRSEGEGDSNGGNAPDTFDGNNSGNSNVSGFLSSSRTLPDITEIYEDTADRSFSEVILAEAYRRVFPERSVDTISATVAASASLSNPTTPRGVRTTSSTGHSTGHSTGLSTGHSTGHDSTGNGTPSSPSVGGVKRTTATSSRPPSIAASMYIDAVKKGSSRTVSSSYDAADVLAAVAEQQQQHQQSNVPAGAGASAWGGGVISATTIDFEDIPAYLNEAEQILANLSVSEKENIKSILKKQPTTATSTAAAPVAAVSVNGRLSRAALDINDLLDPDDEFIDSIDPSELDGASALPQFSYGGGRRGDSDGPADPYELDRFSSSRTLHHSHSSEIINVRPPIAFSSRPSHGDSGLLSPSDYWLPPGESVSGLPPPPPSGPSRSDTKHPPRGEERSVRGPQHSESLQQPLTGVPPSDYRPSAVSSFPVEELVSSATDYSFGAFQGGSGGGINSYRSSSSSAADEEQVRGQQAAAGSNGSRQQGGGSGAGGSLQTPSENKNSKPPASPHHCSSLSSPQQQQPQQQQQQQHSPPYERRQHSTSALRSSTTSFPLTRPSDDPDKTYLDTHRKAATVSAKRRFPLPGTFAAPRPQSASRGRGGTAASNSSSGLSSARPQSASSRLRRSATAVSGAAAAAASVRRATTVGGAGEGEEEHSSGNNNDNGAPNNSSKSQQQQGKPLNVFDALYDDHKPVNSRKGYAPPQPTFRPNIGLNAYRPIEQNKREFYQRLHDEMYARNASLREVKQQIVIEERGGRRPGEEVKLTEAAKQEMVNRMVYNENRKREESIAAKKTEIKTSLKQQSAVNFVDKKSDAIVKQAREKSLSEIFDVLRASVLYAKEVLQTHSKQGAEVGSEFEELLLEKQQQQQEQKESGYENIPPRPTSGAAHNSFNAAAAASSNKKEEAFAATAVAAAGGGRCGGTNSADNRTTVMGGDGYGDIIASSSPAASLADSGAVTGRSGTEESGQQQQHAAAEAVEADADADSSTTSLSARREAARLAYLRLTVVRENKVDETFLQQQQQSGAARYVEAAGAPASSSSSSSSLSSRGGGGGAASGEVPPGGAQQQPSSSSSSSTKSYRTVSVSKAPPAAAVAPADHHISIAAEKLAFTKGPHPDPSQDLLDTRLCQPGMLRPAALATTIGAAIDTARPRGSITRSEFVEIVEKIMLRGDLPPINHLLSGPKTGIDAEVGGGPRRRNTAASASSLLLPPSSVAGGAAARKQHMLTTEEREFLEFTGKPELVSRKRSESLLATRRPNSSRRVEDRIDEHHMEVLKRKEALREELIREQMKECTFMPVLAAKDTYDSGEQWRQ